MSKEILLVTICLLCTACQAAKIESPNALPLTPSALSQSNDKPAPAPTEAELREAIDRNYEGAVTIDNTRPVLFLTGDFNGDDSEDLAIVVKPGKGKLTDLNSEYVNWILEDPHQVLTKETKSRSKRPSITGNDTLLAVIHGYERGGWRNSLARQTYLLKNAVGDDFEKESAQQLASGSKSLPIFKGDIIREKLEGSNGIIFWTGAGYAWHPLGSV